jgi:hypothetical protein
MMSPLTAKQKALLDRFEQMPDSAAVPLETAALVTGTCVRTWRGSTPPLQTFKVSPGKKAVNVGLLRKRARGEL